MRFLAILLAFTLFIPAAKAEGFSFTFDWGSIPLCTSGNPNIVDNPFFKLKNVPEGTKKVYFKLVDENVPKYKHGGGSADYTGAHLIKPGAFKYKSPCPPDGAHSYKWSAYALDADRKILGTATSAQNYPKQQ